MGDIWGEIDFEIVDGWQAPAGFLAFANFPGLFVAADVQLHNRSELNRWLSAKDSSDIELLLLAYEKWDEACTRALEGEFAFCIWDARRKRLYCARDHLGVRRLYYCQHGNRFHFASSPLTLLKNSGLLRRLNRPKLSAMAVPGGHHEFPEETFYQNILSLPGGNALTVIKSNARKWTYWRPEVDTTLIPRDDEQAFEVLRALVSNAVENRLEGSLRPVSLLSGGLDSSAVTAVAANILLRKNRELIAVGAILPENHKGDLEDERNWIERFRPVPNLRIEFTTAEGKGPFDLIDDPSNFEASFQRGPMAFLNDALEDAALYYQGDLLINGIGGEYGITTRAEGYILELLAHLRVSTAIRTLREMKKSIGISPVRFLASELRQALLPNLRRLPMIYFAPGFKQECGTRLKAARYWPDHRKGQIQRLDFALRMHANVNALRMDQPIRWSMPLYDRRLLEYCIASPGHMKIRNGFSRYLVRKSMSGLIPESIRLRPRKIRPSPDYQQRYKVQVGKARDFVRAIGAKDPVRDVVDVDKLTNKLDVSNEWDITMCVPTTIYLICFLRQFDEFKR